MLREPNPRVARLTLASLAAALLIGCETGERQVVVVTDSAGVRLTDIARDQLPVQHVDSTPDLIIGAGTAFGGLEFYGIRTLTVLRDSTIVVSDRDQQIIQIDAATGSVARMGGAGDGPLEFRNLAEILETPDGHLLVIDQGRRRIVELTRDGETVRESQFPQIRTPGAGLRILQAGPPRLERLHIAEVPGLSNSTSGPFRGVGVVLSLSDPSDTLVTFRGPATFVNRGAAGGVMFGATTLFAGSEAGIWIGDTEGQRVELRTPDHELKTVVRWSTDSSRAVNADRIAEFWSRLEEGAPPGQRAGIPEMKKILPFADSIPAFGGLAASPSHVWIRSVVHPEVELLDLPTPPQEWLVVDYRTGTSRRLMMPAGFTLWFATPDYVLGVHRDELGIETIRRYGLPT
jgi:hypothetical protein